MFSEEQTHPFSLCAASVGWSFPLAAWPIPMGILLQVQQLLGETQPAPGLTCMPEEAWRRTMVSTRGLPMGKEQGTSLERLPPLPALPSCYCSPCGQGGQLNAAQSFNH